MAKTKLKTGTRKTTITRIAVREVLKSHSVSGSSLAQKSRKATASKKK